VRSFLVHASYLVGVVHLHPMLLASGELVCSAFVACAFMLLPSFCLACFQQSGCRRGEMDTTVAVYVGLLLFLPAGSATIP
jgi:hypothetical protein